MELNRILIYSRKMDEMVAFYTRHFGYDVWRDPGDRIVELRPSGDGAVIMLHPAGKGRRIGQSLVKLVFDCADVPTTRAALIAQGVYVGTVHDAGSYLFANMKDPDGNSVQISGRSFVIKA